MSRLGSWPRKLWEDFSNVYSSSRNSIRVVHNYESGFGEFITTNRTPIIELNSSYGLSDLRDKVTTTNSATIVSTESEFVLTTGTTANSRAELASSEVGRYIPGYEAELGVGIRLGTLPTGNQTIKWGGYGRNEEDGVYFGYDSGGLYVAILRDGVETDKAYKSNWNIDPVDGTGDSGYNLNTEDGHIYQINFTWYGYGQITFYVIGTVNNIQRPIPVHEFSDFDETSLISPNLRVFGEVDNGGDATSVTAYVAGRQYSILGNYRPKYRLTGQTRPAVSVGSTRIPLISFQRKALFGDRSIKLEGATLIVDGNSNINWEIVLGGTLTSPSFVNPTNHTSTETSLETDISATAISGGHSLYTDVSAANGNNKTALSRQVIDVDLPDDSLVSLCAYTDSGSSDVKAAFRMREEW